LPAVALSRGADEVVFIEQNKITLQKLKANGQMLDVTNAIFLHADALACISAWASSAWLERKKSGGNSNKHSGQMFDLVFLDPPFHSGLLEKSSALINNSGCLAEDAIIYVEHAINDDVVLPENWLSLKEKRSGQVVYKLFENQS